jgi:hypothetical protein
MKSYVLVGFIMLAIVAVIFITRQQRETFDSMTAQLLVKPNIRLSKIQTSQEKVEDALNAGAGKAAIRGIL